MLNESIALPMLSGQVIDEDGVGIPFVTCALYNNSDTELLKVESTDETGHFTFSNIPTDSCRLVLTYIGMDELVLEDLVFKTNQNLDLGQLTLSPSTNELETVVDEQNGFGSSTK